MARTIRIRKDTEAYYHIVSRTNAKAFLFDEKMKREMVKTMLSVAVFSGVKIEAHCMMDNHFHLVVKVMKPEKALTDYEIADRIRAIKKKEVAEAFLCSVMAYQAMGREDLVEAEREKWLRRMHDVSEFVKTYKETVTRIYKKDHEYVGSIWSGRFKSTLIENDDYLQTVIRYVELNPVRAEMVEKVSDYAYSSHRTVEPEEEDLLAQELEAKLHTRQPQLSGGKVCGSKAFVCEVIGVCLRRAKRRAIWAFANLYSSHGHLIAKAAS